jgi:hypothetical protein
MNHKDRAATFCGLGLAKRRLTQVDPTSIEQLDLSSNSSNIDTKYSHHYTARFLGSSLLAYIDEKGTPMAPSKRRKLVSGLYVLGSSARRLFGSVAEIRLEENLDHVGLVSRQWLCSRFGLRSLDL